MPAPLDPVIAEIIPLLPLRDPRTMTPQSSRDALRALAASRAAVPPPPVDSVEDVKVKGGAGPLAARVYRMAKANRRRWYSSTAAAGWPAISKPTTGRRATLPSRPGRSWSPSITAGRRKRAFPARSRTPLLPCATSFERIAEFGGDANRLGVAGDSAGGNLAAATAIACRDAGIKLAAQLLVYPVTDVVRELRRHKARTCAFRLAPRMRKAIFCRAR